MFCSILLDKHLSCRSVMTGRICCRIFLKKYTSYILVLQNFLSNLLCALHAKVGSAFCTFMTNWCIMILHFEKKIYWVLFSVLEVWHWTCLRYVCGFPSFSVVVLHPNVTFFAERERNIFVILPLILEYIAVY